MNHRSLNKVSKEKVLKAALDLFSSKGYSETKMAEIARGAGLSVGALYLRFRNKEELFLELIKDQTRDFVEKTAKLPSTDPVKSLRKYIAMNLEYSLQKRQLISVFFKEYNLPFLHSLRANFFKTQHIIIADILTAGIKKRVFGHVRVKDTAAVIFASIRGAVFLKLIFGVGDVRKMSQSLFELVTDGIRIRR